MQQTYDLAAGRPTPARVLVVDDHRTFTDLVVLALAAEPDLDCVGAAHDADSARAMVQQHAPDVILMDVNLGAQDGLDLTAELVAAHPGLRVVVLTAHGDAAVMRRAATAGACALLPKDGSLPELLLDPTPQVDEAELPARAPGVVGIEATTSSMSGSLGSIRKT